MSETTESVSDLRARIVEVEGENFRLQSENDSLEREIDDLEGQVASLEGEIDDLEFEVDSLRHELSERDQEEHEALSRVEQLLQDVDLGITTLTAARLRDAIDGHTVTLAD